MWKNANGRCTHTQDPFVAVSRARPLPSCLQVDQGWKCLGAMTKRRNSWDRPQISVDADGLNFLNSRKIDEWAITPSGREVWCRCGRGRWWWGQIWARRRICESVERNKCWSPRKLDGWLQWRRVFIGPAREFMSVSLRLRGMRRFWELSVWSYRCTASVSILPHLKGMRRFLKIT